MSSLDISVNSTRAAAPNATLFDELGGVPYTPLNIVYTFGGCQHYCCHGVANSTSVDMHTHALNAK